MKYIPEVFSPEDEVARFVLAMTMAGGDIDRTLRLAAQAYAVDSPDATSYVRWTTGFFFEAQLALRAYEQTYPEVRNFLAALPADARERLKVVRGFEQRLGGDLAEHARNYAFHFPHPSRRHALDGDTLLGRAVEHQTDEPVVVSAGVNAEGELAEVHYAFANGLSLVLAFWPFAEDDAELGRQQALVRDAALAFRACAHEILNAYLDSRPGSVSIRPLDTGGA